MWKFNWYRASVAIASLAAAPMASADEPLFVYCCAGFRPPLERAARAFQAETGVNAELTFAGSGCLIAQAELAGKGDLFLPGEEHYMEGARSRGIIQGLPRAIAYLRPVIATRPGLDVVIDDLDDLGLPGLRVGLGDPQSVAVGMATERWFRAELSEDSITAIHDNVTTRAINVNELGLQLSVGGIDAAIVWDVTVPLFESLGVVAPESGIDHRTVITGGVLSMSRQSEAAARFLSFLAGPTARAIFVEHGYTPADIDVAAFDSEVSTDD